MLEHLLLIIIAFLGGGVVTLAIEHRRESKRNIRAMILLQAEIKANLRTTESQVLRDNPWMRQKIWRSMYDHNCGELIASTQPEEAERIIRFYADLDILHELEWENDELDRLRREGRMEEFAIRREELGKTKRDIRKSLMRMGEKIVGSRSPYAKQNVTEEERTAEPASA